MKLLGLVILAACSYIQTIPEIRSYVRVENNHWLEQVVYANCGARIRVGIAAGIRETLLRLPADCENRSVWFTTDPIGSNEISKSDMLELRKGDVVILQIPAIYNNYLFLSR